MKLLQHVYTSLSLLAMTLLTVACQPTVTTDKFSLSCGDMLTIRENDTDIIEVTAGGDFIVETDNSNALCRKNGTHIIVKGVKLGKCILTVTVESGEQVACTITVEKSAEQKDFLIFSNPRIENWQDTTVYVEKTNGLQVTCEKDTDVAGYSQPSTTTYGYYFIESGKFCRLSAPTDFGIEGNFPGGVVAVGDGNNDTRYYLCENIAVLKVMNGKAWIEASMAMRADLRMVVELN